MTACLLDDLHNSLHRGEQCPECGHDPYAETSAPDISEAAESDPEGRYLIRKGGVFYRPNAQGYTSTKADAGRYTLAEAIRHSHPNGPEGPRDGIDYMLDDEPPVEDLRPWGWAPGGYMFICKDCPADISIMDKMDRAGDKRSYRCREHAIAARDAAAAAPVPEPIYVVWWTTQTDCEFVDALCEVDDGTLVEWPDWLRIQWSSRDGRNGRGRLWNAFPDALPAGIDPFPDNLLGRLIGGDTTDSGRHSAAGIVIPLGDLNLVIGLPGFVTTAGMTRLLIHGVDLDL